MTSLQEKQLTPPGASNVLTSERYPEIRGGVCEYCGVIDNNYSGPQYKLCPHYKGRDMKCVFCKDSADHDDVIRQSKLLVMADPYNPNGLVTLCNRYECTRKFEEKYHVTPQ